MPQVLTRRVDLNLRMKSGLRRTYTGDFAVRRDQEAMLIIPAGICCPYMRAGNERK